MKKKKKHKLSLPAVFEIALFFSALYFWWRVSFTIPFIDEPAAFFLGIVLLVVELVGLIEFMVNFQIMAKKKNYPLPKIPEKAELYPDVDVFIATYNESADLLYRTVNGCRRMEYPDQSKVHIYLCDDGHREEIRTLARKMNIGYFTRDNNEGAKAGNLNNALNQTDSPLVVTFDADMIPRSSFLMKTVPYFIDSWMRNTGVRKAEQIRLGFLQTPQTFYNWDLFQYHLYAEKDVANEQDYFYREIEVAKTNSNSVIYGGSNTLISREALESVGGFYTKAITEDFATGMLIERNGFVSLAISEPLASGLAPEDLPSLIQQRIRWGRGVVNVLYQINLFFTNKFSTAQKVNYWTSIQYWLAPFSRFLYIFIPIISGIFGISVVRTPLWAALCFWLPTYIADSWAIGRLSGNIRTSLWTNLYETIMFPFLMGPIFMEFIGISLKKFKVTKKGVDNTDHFSWRYIWPFVLMLVLTLIAVISISYKMIFHLVFDGSITLFWLLYNSLLLIVAILFFIGRRQGSLISLHHAAVFAKLKQDKKTYEGAIAALGEAELEVIFDEQPKLSKDEVFRIEVEYEGHSFELPVRLIRLFKARGLIINRFEILKSDQEYLSDQYDHFLRMVYDRPIPTQATQKVRFFLPLIARHIKEIKLTKQENSREQWQDQIQNLMTSEEEIREKYFDNSDLIDSNSENGIKYPKDSVESADMKNLEESDR